MKLFSVFGALVTGYLVAEASAASASCSFSTTINASTALSQLNSCPTLDGQIQISGDKIGSVDLNNVEEVKGDLKLFNSSSATALNMNKLKTISGSLTVDAFTQLHNIDFSSLTKVEKLSLISLPSFAQINLNKGISEAGSITLSDTALSSLEGLIDYDHVGALDINNNKNISKIDLRNLESVSDRLSLSFNSDDCEVNLDNLEWASNLTIQDVSDLSIGNLTSVNSTFLIAYNKFDKIEFKNLKKIGGALQFFANDEVTEVSFDSLEEVGGEVDIYNNTDLQDMGDSFKKLKTIDGAVSIKGEIANFSLPSLSKIDGTFNLKSTSDKLDCSDVNKQVKKKVKGHNASCSAPKKSSLSKSSKSTKGSDSDSKSSSKSSSDSSSSSSSSKKSDANTLMVASALFTTVITSVFTVFI